MLKGKEQYLKFKKKKTAHCRLNSVVEMTEDRRKEHRTNQYNSPNLKSGEKQTKKAAEMQNGRRRKKKRKRTDPQGLEET